MHHPKNRQIAQTTDQTEDFLDVNALCAGSMAAITTGAAAIGAYGGAIHAACRYNHLLKTPMLGAKGKVKVFVVLFGWVGWLCLFAWIAKLVLHKENPIST